MRFLDETIAETAHAVRLAAPGQWLIRALCGASLIGAGLLCQMLFPIAGEELFLGVIVGAALWTIVRPESWAPLVGIGAAALWLLIAGASASWWQSATVAGLLAVFHLTAALCATAPPYAAIRRGAAASMLGRGLGYLAVCGAVMLLVGAVAAVPAAVLPRGLGWVAVALATAVAAAAFAFARIKER